MRTFLVAVIVALLTATAYSQGMGGGSGGGKGGGRHRGGEQKVDDAQKKKKAAEADKAYKSAIDSLPDQKFDPWRNMR